MHKLKIGIMGVASIARRLMAPAIKAMPKEFELVAVASRTSEKAEEFGREFSCEGITGYQNLLDRNDIDAIYMPLPTGLHLEWVLKCLEAGKHVLVEKSLAKDSNSAEKMVSLAKEQGLLLMENFMFQYHSQHNFIWNALKENQLGEIRLFTARFGFPPLDKNNFRYNHDLGGGALLDAGAYTIKAAQWFLQSKLSVKTANVYIDSHIGVDIYGDATLVNQSGLTAQISYGFDNYYQCFYELWGSKGKLRADRAFTSKPNEKPPIIFERPGAINTIEMPADDHFVNLLREFHGSIMNKNYSGHFDDILQQSILISELRNRAEKVML